SKRIERLRSGLVTRYRIPFARLAAALFGLVVLVAGRSAVAGCDPATAQLPAAAQAETAAQLAPAAALDASDRSGLSIAHAPGRVVVLGTEHAVVPGESLTALGARYAAPVA